MYSTESIQKLMAPLLPGLMGMQLQSVAAERVEATMVVRPDLCTSGHTLHGGAMMAFADTLGAVGTFVNLPEGKRTVTIESSTKFIGGAKEGSTLNGECVALHRGRTTMVWQTNLRNPDGKLCAVVTQTQIVLDA